MYAASNLINSINESQEHVKYVKKERGLFERRQNEDVVILTEDNRQMLLD